MRKRLGLRPPAGLVALAGVTAGLLLATGPAALANNPVTGAAFTTTNTNVDLTGHCKNGNEDVNCNIYDGKKFVWLNGGPKTAYVGDGSYFFAVLQPGGQADPNDGAAKNLSDDSDAYTNRTFSVADGTISYSGSHDFDSNKIRLMQYADTGNPGGVYIMAICSLGNGYPVKPSSCKYDAFKVQGSTPTTTGLPLTISKDANGSYDKTWTWGITKDVDHTILTSANGSATFTYTVDVTHDGGTISDVKVTGTISVFNPNVDASNDTLPVDIEGVTDQLSDNTVCTVTDGGPQTLTQLKTDFAYSCDLGNDLPSGSLDNTTTVSWGDQVLDGGASLAGDSADFTLQGVSFDEAPVDDSVTVTDPLSPTGTLGTVSESDASPTPFTYSHMFTGDAAGTCTSHTNTATFTTDTTGTTGSAGQAAQQCVGADLQVAKTASPAFKRTYSWTITKSVDRTLVKQLNGSAVFNYTVKASETGFSDSGWIVTGTITVTNPNDWEAVSLSTVSDVISNGGSCSLTSGNTTASIAAGDSASFDYKCTYSTKPAYSATNTATATWDKSAASTADGSASGTADASFTSPTSTVNKTVTITDSFNGGTASPLGTLTATDSTPFASATYTYARTIPIPSSACRTYPNKAAITETGQYANASVQVCRIPAPTGALTMGYWQNKNGQAIITGGAATSGVCNSGTWLRQYAPFQDLGATATCSQVAGYVSSIIKTANASGAAMNAMLKAQMLATALDVYFSDGSLGGNKIGAPAPIGGVLIDLTSICKMSDSNGTGTCSGIYYDVSGAFGGAAKLTVSQMLAFAAGQSNSGGSTWYANVKSTQEMAKNAFDAINNQSAFQAAP